jgi:hypothetical protein
MILNNFIRRIVPLWRGQGEGKKTVIRKMILNNFIRRIVPLWRGQGEGKTRLLI